MEFAVARPSVASGSSLLAFLYLSLTASGKGTMQHLSCEPKFIHLRQHDRKRHSPYVYTRECFHGVGYERSC